MHRPTRLFQIALLLVAFISTSNLSAQEKFEWEHDDIPFSKSFSKWNEKSPAVNLFGGLSTFDRYKIDSTIEDDLFFGIELGMERISTSNDAEGIAEKTFDGLFLFYHLAPSNTNGTMTTELWRFGFADETSYGYKFGEGNAGLYLGAGSSPLTWGTVNVQQVGADSVQMAELLRLDDGLRFGEQMNADIDVRFAEPVSLMVRYDWTQIYPRHMFWYWGLSLMIEGVSKGLLSAFINSIGNSSPAALPIMNFILQNGLSMGFKALRMNKMNWPFDTEAPLNVMSYSVGVSVHF